MYPHSLIARRRFLHRLVAGALALRTPGALAGMRRTPLQTEGPFYPDVFPPNIDNDLVMIAGRRTAATGEVTHLEGRILDAHGEPVTGAVVEIWQVDHNGVYLNSADRHAARDVNFQGFGRFVTGRSGAYSFRTIKPVPYPGRTPHIHFKVRLRGRPIFTTQCYVRGEPRNAHDVILNSIRDRKARESVIVPFVPFERERAGELHAHFDIVLGYTPAA